MNDEELYLVAGILHESRMTECYGNWHDFSARKKWPGTFKEFRAQYQAGQSWIDQAVAQARALEKNELLRPIRVEALRQRLPSGNSATDVPSRIRDSLGTVAQQHSPASSSGRTPDFDSGNCGSNPRAGTSPNTTEKPRG